MSTIDQLRMSTSRILLCGGGNAIHVLAAYFGAKPGTHVTILSLYPGEADRLRNAIPSEGIRCVNDLGEDDIVGRPDAVTSSASDVPDDLDLVIFALPSFTHEMYLKALRPHLREGVSIGAMPGEGGFDLCAIHNLGGAFAMRCDLFAFETLPWACRILEYGSKVEVLGTKKDVDVVVSPKLGVSPKAFIDGLQGLIGPLPHLTPADNFLSVTLMNINSVWHPTISWGFYHDLDTNKPFDKPPLFYTGASEETGEKLDKVSNEVLEIKRVLLERYPSLHLDSLTHVREWMTNAYGDDIADTTSIATMLRTNKGYQGLTHPMREVQSDGKTKYLPDFRYRYFSEDIPMGLVVTKGIAELANVATPHMDEVITWCSKMMGKEYLVNGKLRGKDLHETRCPQHYGFTDLDTFLRVNHYLEESVASGTSKTTEAQFGVAEGHVMAQ